MFNLNVIKDVSLLKSSTFQTDYVMVYGSGSGSGGLFEVSFESKA
jgi:hypothetical protein